MSNTKKLNWNPGLVFCSLSSPDSGFTIHWSSQRTRCIVSKSFSLYPLCLSIALFPFCGSLGSHQSAAPFHSPVETSLPDLPQLPSLLRGVVFLARSIFLALPESVNIRSLLVSHQPPQPPLRACQLPSPLLLLLFLDSLDPLPTISCLLPPHYLSALHEP